MCVYVHCMFMCACYMFVCVYMCALFVPMYVACEEMCVHVHAHWMLAICVLYVCICVHVYVTYLCVLYVYIHVCWCEYSYVLYVCVYVHIFMTRHMSVQVSLPLWVRKDLSLNLQLAILHKLASKPVVFPHLLTLSTGATYVLPHLDFRQALGTEFTFSCLLSKYFDHCANSPPLLCISHTPPIKHGPTPNHTSSVTRLE